MAASDRPAKPVGSRIVLNPKVTQWIVPTDDPPLSWWRRALIRLAHVGISTPTNGRREDVARDV